MEPQASLQTAIRSHDHGLSVPRRKQRRRPSKLSSNRTSRFRAESFSAWGSFDDTDTIGVAPRSPKCGLNSSRIRRMTSCSRTSAAKSQRHPNTCAPPVCDQLRRPKRGRVRSRWPDLMGIVEEKVKPQPALEQPCQLQTLLVGLPRSGLSCNRAIRGLQRVLCSRSASRLALPFYRPSCLPRADSLFSFDTYAAFAALQSRPHEVWTRFLGSSMKDDLRYTPSDCFETFPFPASLETDANLEAAGRRITSTAPR